MGKKRPPGPVQGGETKRSKRKGMGPTAVKLEILAGMVGKKKK